MLKFVQTVKSVQLIPPLTWCQKRWYNPQSLVDTIGARYTDRAKSLQSEQEKRKTFKPALDHFRLTRFGWEHEKAGSDGERRRFKNAKASQLARRVGYVHPRDYKTMRVYFPHVHVKRYNTPVDPNVNITQERDLLPTHIG